MNRAEDVAVHNKCSRHSSREDDTVGLAYHYGYTLRQVCAYRETVRLRRVLVADQDANHVTLVDLNHGPRVRGRSVSNAIVKSREVGDDEKVARRPNTTHLGHNGRRSCAS
jgi:hypothetical protein